MIGGNVEIFCMHHWVLTTHPVKMRIKIVKDLYTPCNKANRIEVSWKELKGKFKQAMWIKLFDGRVRSGIIQNPSRNISLLCLPMVDRNFID